MNDEWRTQLTSVEHYCLVVAGAMCFFLILLQFLLFPLFFFEYTGELTLYDGCAYFVLRTIKQNERIKGLTFVIINMRENLFWRKRIVEKGKAEKIKHTALQKK